MNQTKITPHVPKIALWYKDEKRELALAYVESKHAEFIKNAIEKCKFLKLPDGLIIPVRNIEKIDLNCKLDDLDQFILSQPRKVRKYLDEKEKNMKGNIGRGITSVEHAQSIIEKAKEQGFL
jgi:hypothetical protein